jgi:SAM-dependent methyltransferase
MPLKIYRMNVDMRAKSKLTHSRYLVHSFLLKNVKKFAKEICRKKNSAILDIGCATKPYEILFREECDEISYIGLDLNPKSYADVISIGENMPFKDGSFDNVLCTQALEHTIDPDKVVKETFRLLKREGSLLISTHGVWIEGHEHPDNWRWTGNGLVKLLKSNGYEIERCISMPPISSIIQLLILYIPEFPPTNYSIIPLCNILARFLQKTIKIGPKIHVVHILKASKITPEVDGLKVERS